MGNIFAVVSLENVWSKPEELFKAGLDLARRIKSQAPKNTIDVAYARAASFARRNGSGGKDGYRRRYRMLADGRRVVVSRERLRGGGREGLLRRAVEKTITRVASGLEGFFVIVFATRGRARSSSSPI